VQNGTSVLVVSCETFDQYSYTLTSGISLHHSLSFVTEQVAEHTNGTVGALLNATFGNAPELLISIAALKSGYYRVVQLCMVGSILTNMIFVFGVACIIGGTQWQQQQLRIVSGNVVVGMMLLAISGFLFPAALIQSGQLPYEIEKQEQQLMTRVPSRVEVTFCRVNAFVMIFVYFCYLLFQLGTHKHEFDDDGECGRSRAGSMDLTIAGRHHHGRAIRNLFCLRAAQATRRGLFRTSMPSVRSVDSNQYAHGDKDGTHIIVIDSSEEQELEFDAGSSSEEEITSSAGHLRRSGIYRNESSSFTSNGHGITGFAPRVKKEMPRHSLEAHGNGVSGKRSSERRPRRGRRTARAINGEEMNDRSNRSLRHRSRKSELQKIKYSDDGEHVDTFSEDDLSTDDDEEKHLLRAGSSSPIVSRNASLVSSAPIQDAAAAAATALPHTDMPVLSLRAGILWLFLITLCISALSDILVDTIDAFARRMRLSEVFTSMVILPFFSNVAEQVSAFIFAYRNEMDLVVGVTIGSAIQIATLVLPGSVLMGCVMDRSMTMYFRGYETVCLVFATFVVGSTLQSGSTNWLVGVGTYWIVGYRSKGLLSFALLTALFRLLGSEVFVGIYIIMSAGIWFHETEVLTVDGEVAIRNITRI